MIRKLAIGLFLLITAAVVAILAIAATQPATYHVERGITTTAPPQQVFAVVNDMHRFPEWSPWEKLDPAMKTTFAGPTSGNGASYSWIGNSQAGEGRMTITESMPANHVALKLEFVKPFASTCDIHFRIEPQGDGSRVTWSMDGNNNFMGKVMCLFMNMDKMVGKDFEAGLASLDRVSAVVPPREINAAPDSSSFDSTAAARP